MTTTTTTPIAIMVQAEDSYSQHHIRAYVMLPQDDGSMHSAQRWSGDAARQYAGFRLTARVGHGYDTSRGDENPGEIWGWSVEYTDVMIESAEQATEIARVLRKIETGMRKIEDTEGYTSDLAVWIMRIARILKIKDLYVRNGQQAYGMSGERYRAVSGSALQWWVSDAVRLAKKGSWRELIKVG